MEFSPETWINNEENNIQSLRQIVSTHIEHHASAGLVAVCAVQIAGGISSNM